jgi:hypothetical protein
MSASTMEQSGWKPGPWRTVNGNLIAADGSCVEFGGSFGFAIGSVSNRPDRVANSHVAIAAPELFEALAELLKWFDQSGSSLKARWDRIPPEDVGKVVTMSRDARAKALGQ